MAIITDYITNAGASMPQQYAKIEVLHATKTDVVIDIGFYLSYEQSLVSAPYEILTLEYPYDISTVDANPVAMAYLMIKQDFPNAVDV